MHGPAIGKLRLSVDSNVTFQIMGDQGSDWRHAQVSVNGLNSKVWTISLKSVYLTSL